MPIQLPPFSGMPNRLPPGLGVPGIPGVNTQAPPLPQSQPRQSPFLDPRFLDVIGQITSALAGGGYGNMAYNESRQRGLQNQMAQQQAEEDRLARQRQEQRQQEQLELQKREAARLEGESKGRQGERDLEAAKERALAAAYSNVPYESLNEPLITAARYKQFQREAEQADELQKLAIESKRQGIDTKKRDEALKLAKRLVMTKQPWHALPDDARLLISPEEYDALMEEDRVNKDELKMKTAERNLRMAASMASIVRSKAEAESATALAEQRRNPKATTGQPTEEDYLRMALALVSRSPDADLTSEQEKIQKAGELIPALKQIMSVAQPVPKPSPQAGGQGQAAPVPKQEQIKEYKGHKYRFNSATNQWELMDEQSAANTSR